MEESLIDCCQIFLQLLVQLRDTGRITQEEYEVMAKKKIMFLEKINNY